MATTSKEEIANIRARTGQLRQRSVDSEFGNIPESVVFLRTLIQETVSEDKRLILYSMLIDECTIVRNDKLLIHHMRKRIEDTPTDPIACVSLSFQLAH